MHLNKTSWLLMLDGLVVSLQILTQDNNPGIEYSYTLPNPDGITAVTQTPDNYTWSLSQSSCSEPCGGGMSTTSMYCEIIIIC